MTYSCTKFADDATSDSDGNFGTEPVALLVDLDRRLIDASRAAEALLDDASKLERSFGRLAARNQGDMRRIERALNEARWRGVASLTLEADFQADIVRMDADRRSPRFLILSRQDDDCQRAARAADRFGLTPAENRLLKCLLEGLALGDAASRLGVARTTARTHLQRIFDKTGVRRQTDLQRMVALS